MSPIPPAHSRRRSGRSRSSTTAGRVRRRLWLHLGAFGPRRLATSFPSTAPPASPAQLVDNQETLLDHSDLVFVDAIGTGYSQAIAPHTNAQFWGVDQDAAAFRDFVRRYVAANNRQASPLYLFGESYGAPRTAVLANLLESAGVRVAGVMLQSAIMDYNPTAACSIPAWSAAKAISRAMRPCRPTTRTAACRPTSRRCCSARASLPRAATAAR